MNNKCTYDAIKKLFNENQSWALIPVKVRKAIEDSTIIEINPEDKTLRPLFLQVCPDGCMRFGMCDIYDNGYDYKEIDMDTFAILYDIARAIKNGD